MKVQVTIIGFGTMGKTISKVILKNNRFIKVYVIDKNNSKTNTSRKNISRSDFIILSVKPQNSNEAIEQIKSHINKSSILISIMAGVSIKKLISLSNHKKIVRMMPNLGLSVGHGIAVWKGVGLSKLEAKKAKIFMNGITENFEVKNEDTINKATAISGNGPAYFFLLADCLIKACDALGLGKDEGRQLVAKTFSASAVLARDSNYSGLIKKIASKRGTTEAALKVFKKEKFNRIILKAVRTAYARAKELNYE